MYSKLSGVKYLLLFKSMVMKFFSQRRGMKMVFAVQQQIYLTKQDQCGVLKIKLINKIVLA